MTVTFVVLAKASSVCIPLSLKLLLDSLEYKKEEVIYPIIGLPFLLVFIYGGVRVFNTAFNEFQNIVFSRVSAQATRELTTATLKHLHELSVRFHFEKETGSIIRNLERGTRSLSALLNYFIFSVIPVFVEIFLILFILISEYNKLYSLIVFITAAIYMFFTLKTLNKRMNLRKEMNYLDSKAHGEALEGLFNYEAIKIFNNKDLEISRCDDTLRKWEDSDVLMQKSLSFLNIEQNLIIILGSILIMLIAVNQVSSGEMTVGDLVLVNSFLFQLFIPISSVGIVYSQIIYTLVDLGLLIDLLNKEPEVKDKPDASNLLVKHGYIRFENVSFGYYPDRQIVSGINFTVAPREKVAIVGTSGSGKTTLIRLLLRFYDVDEGRITIDGIDIRDVTQSSLHSALGVVSQDTVLFNNSIYYNLSYARFDAQYEEIIEAAKSAHIHDFIKSLPNGYSTIVGERGLKLSGGEKQRISLARMLIKKPKIIILDEATAALDSKSDYHIRCALKRINYNAILFITHRLSNILDANRILVMDKGRIVEEGSHEELLENEGFYAQLWALRDKQ